MISFVARLLNTAIEEALVWSREAVAAAPSRAEAHYHHGVARHARNPDEAIGRYIGSSSCTVPVRRITSQAGAQPEAIRWCAAFSSAGVFGTNGHPLTA